MPIVIRCGPSTKHGGLRATKPNSMAGWFMIFDAVRLGIWSAPAFLKRLRWISGYRTRHVFDRYNIVTDKDFATAAQQMTNTWRDKRSRNNENRWTRVT